MSCAKIDPALHQAQKPPWIKVRLPSNPVFFSTKALISDLRLHTVCESAHCPNRWECWSQGTATFMIAGDRCTRACGFCAVTTAKPFALEGDEPKRVAAMLANFEEFNGRMVLGEPTIEPRVVAAPIRMPLPPADHQGSIYENQRSTARRFFATLEDARAG